MCCLFYSHLHQWFFGLQQTVTGCVAQQNSYMNTDATWNVNGADTIHTNVCVCAFGIIKDMSVHQGGAAFIVSGPISPSCGGQNNNICRMFAFPSDLKFNLDQTGLKATSYAVYYVSRALDSILQHPSRPFYDVIDSSTNVAVPVVTGSSFVDRFWGGSFWTCIRNGT